MRRLWPPSVTAGTIFEQSKKPLALWFRAIFEVTASKQGISAAELQRKLGLGSYQTAWSWLQKIRTAMVRPNREPLSDEVEIDESYVGGPEPGKPVRAAEKKAIIAAAVEKRGPGCGRVRLGLIADVSAAALLGFVEKHLGGGETAHTDGWRGYAPLAKTGYQHIVSVLAQLDRTAAAVLPRVHLIFSLIKRWILGTHQGSLSLKHLDGYLEEFTFRFNRRRARRITHGAERVLGIATATPPRPFWKIVGRPGPSRLAAAA
jgi:ISXO2-like transposase domain